MSGDADLIARAALALLADVLRRFQPRVASPQLHLALDVEKVDEWGRQVLAWQDQLDGPPEPTPELPAAPAPGDLLIAGDQHRVEQELDPEVSVCHQCASRISDPEADELTGFSVDGVYYEKIDGHWRANG